jgi:hypothetical protein
MPGDHHEISITLRWCRSIYTGSRSWRNDDRNRKMTFGDGVVDGLAVIRAIGCHRRDVGIGLIKQVRYFGNVTDLTRRQFRRGNLVGGGVNTEVQLAPPPRDWMPCF